MKSAPIVRIATADDIDSIYHTIASYSEEGILLARNRDDISARMDNFYIAEVNNTVVGVITYHDYCDNLKEIRSLAVNRNYLRRGIGSFLLRRLIRDLSANDNPKIFVLTYSPEFFRKNGFVDINMDSLPEKIWKDCIYCINQDTCNEIALEYVGR
ncbi:MAG: GNAT family N-acetyltransferase [Spirochaetes bacterium]|nr:GNAT family N-acetyltransferase [Spirochaetota bacterium]